MTRRSVGRIDSGVAVLRATLITALCGHAVANAIFDRDQYRGATGDLLSSLDEPLLVQCAIGLVAIAILTVWGRRRARAGREPLLSRRRYGAQVLLLLLAQLALFVGMEMSERLAIDEMFEGEPEVGVLGVGFVPELLVAVGSAVLLAALREATRGLLDRVRTVIRVPAGDPTSWSTVREGAGPTPRALTGAGGVRAPPR